MTRLRTSTILLALALCGNAVARADPPAFDVSPPPEVRDTETYLDLETLGPDEYVTVGGADTYFVETEAFNALARDGTIVFAMQHDVSMPPVHTTVSLADERQFAFRLTDKLTSRQQEFVAVLACSCDRATAKDPGHRRFYVATALIDSNESSSLEQATFYDRMPRDTGNQNLGPNQDSAVATLGRSSLSRDLVTNQRPQPFAERAVFVHGRSERAWLNQTFTV